MVPTTLSNSSFGPKVPDLIACITFLSEAGVYSYGLVVDIFCLSGSISSTLAPKMKIFSSPTS